MKLKIHSVRTRIRIYKIIICPVVKLNETYETDENRLRIFEIKILTKLKIR